LKEEEVVQKAIKWAEANGYTYIGKGKPNQNSPGSDIPVPGSEREVLIDGKAEKDSERLWIEAKGDVGLSQIIEAVGRLLFAVFYGGGKAILAVDKERAEKTLKYRDFFKWLTEGCTDFKILDVESGVTLRVDSL
jgi:hypothetical protein